MHQIYKQNVENVIRQHVQVQDQAVDVFVNI